MELLNRQISCPYCGENIALLIDDSTAEQDYYEDCSVSLSTAWSGSPRLKIALSTFSNK